VRHVPVALIPAVAAAQITRIRQICWASVQSEDLADVPRFGDAFEFAETDVREGDA
jgi:hypothetical protein